MPRTILIGAPIDTGQRRPGCLMGPAAYRVAGLAQAIGDLGHRVEDWGDLFLSALPSATGRALPWALVVFHSTRTR